MKSVVVLKEKRDAASPLFRRHRHQNRTLEEELKAHPT